MYQLNLIEHFNGLTCCDKTFIYSPLSRKFSLAKFTIYINGATMLMYNTIIYRWESSKLA